MKVRIDTKKQEKVDLRTYKLDISICMIVKNEEKHLERCLRALTDLRKRTKSELIIADTGSTDRTWEIAEQYADVLYHFPWVNDFSAARNSGIEKAQGRWVLILDADEELIRCDETVALVKRTSLGADTAYYTLKSLLANGGWTTGHSARLFLNTPEHRYANAVHEQMQNIQYYQELADVVHHYGYADAENLTEKSAGRNIPLLLSDIEKGEDLSRSYLQLAQEYNVTGEYTEALEAVDKGLEALAASDAVAQTKRHYGATLHLLAAKVHGILENYEVSYQSALCARSKDEDESIANLEVYFYCTQCQIKLKNYADAVNYAFRYLNTYEKWRKGKLDLSFLKSIAIDHCNSSSRDQLLSMGVYAAVQAMDFAAIPKLIAYAEKEYKRLEGASFYALLFLGCRQEAEVLHFSRLLSYVIENNRENKGLEQLYRAIDLFALQNMRLAQRLIEQLIEQLPQETELQRRLLAARYACAPRGKKLDAAPYQVATQAAVDQLDEQQIALLLLAGFGDKQRLEIAAHIVPFDLVPRLSPFLRPRLLEREAVIKNWLFTIQEQEPLACIFWKTYAAEGILLERKEEAATELELFLVYTKLLYTYATQLYNPQLFTDREAFLLPAVYRFGFACGEALTAWNNGETMQSIKRFIEACKLYPVMLPYANALLEQVRSEAEPTAQQQEMVVLGNKIKETIQTLLSENRVAEAETILKQYRQIAPQDPELQSLEQQLYKSV